MSEVKTIYLATRSPSLARDEFPRRWRRHGNLAKSLGFWRHSTGYLHCDIDEEPPSDADPETGAAWSGAYDGVGCVYFPSTQAYESLVTHRDFPKLLMDEWGLFAEPVANFSVLTYEELFIERAGTGAKFFAFLRALRGISEDEFAEAWRAHAAFVMRSDELMGLACKYVHNHPVVVEQTGDEDTSIRERIETGLQVAGVAEMGFASRADMIRFLGHPARLGVRQDLERFSAIDGLIMVAANEVTMDNRVAPVDPD
jgi:hypothetical protein